MSILFNLHQYGKSSMQQISWTKEWCVGNEIIDQQHKNILKIINRLIELYEIETNSEIIISLLNDFQVCANEHLHYEEYVLYKNHYHDLDNHKKAHRHYLDNFYAKLLVVRNNYSSQNIYDLILLLRDWWTQHIVIEDIKYRTLFI